MIYFQQQLLLHQPFWVFSTKKYSKKIKIKKVHVKVKHETNGGYVVKIGNEKFHTNNIENFWSIFKRGIIGIYHFVSVKHLERYCEEFSYRYNRRNLTGVEKFESALLKVATTRITYNNLIGK